MPVRRRQSGPWPELQKAFHAACIQAGFGATEDTNGTNPSGIGVSPTNNLDGMRMSAALTHLNPMRHCLNLTVRGVGFRQEGFNPGFTGRRCGSREWRRGFHRRSRPCCFVRRGDQIAPPAHAFGNRPRRPNYSNLGIPTVHLLPGVGQNLFNHLSAQITFKVKDRINLASHDADAVQFGLHYTLPRVKRIQRYGAEEQPDGRPTSRSASPVYGPST